MTAITIDHARLAKVVTLSEGAHRESEGEMCAMEAVAFIAGEPWSDHPTCASPVIGAFMRAWNDGLPQEDRDALILPLIPRLVGTRGSEALENRRATMAADWLVRVHTPAWLRLAGLTTQADALSGLPEITDFANTPSLRGPLEAARQDAAAARAAAGAAAWAAAWAAAGAAAWAAARAAARAAAGAAAWDAAWAAAGDAAWAAAGAAAWDAAGDAAKEKLEPTRLELQQSALALVNRMISLAEAPSTGEQK
jgi:hypothetical protein